MPITQSPYTQVISQLLGFNGVLMGMIILHIFMTLAFLSERKVHQRSSTA